MGMTPGIIGPACCYCGRRISGVGKAVKGAGTYVGWRHGHCYKPTNLKVWSEKYAEAEGFVQVLRSGDRSSLHPALQWGR